MCVSYNILYCIIYVQNCFRKGKLTETLIFFITPNSWTTVKVISHFSPTTTHVVQLRGRHFVQALAQIGNKGKAEVLHLMVMTSDGQADGQEAMPNGHPFCQIQEVRRVPKDSWDHSGCSTLLFYFILFHYLSRSQPDSHEKPSVDRLLSISSCMAVIQPAFLRYHTDSHG